MWPGRERLGTRLHPTGSPLTKTTGIEPTVGFRAIAAELPSVTITSGLIRTISAAAAASGSVFAA